MGSRAGRVSGCEQLGSRRLVQSEGRFPWLHRMNDSSERMREEVTGRTPDARLSGVLFHGELPGCPPHTHTHLSAVEPPIPGARITFMTVDSFFWVRAGVLISILNKRERQRRIPPYLTNQTSLGGRFYPVWQGAIRVLAVRSFMKQNVLTFRGLLRALNAFIAGQGSRHLVFLHPEHLSLSPALSCLPAHLSQEREQQGETELSLSAGALRHHFREREASSVSPAPPAKAGPCRHSVQVASEVGFPHVTMTVTAMSPCVSSHSFLMGNSQEASPSTLRMSCPHPRLLWSLATLGPQTGLSPCRACWNSLKEDPNINVISHSFVECANLIGILC